jgi:hypothetical protein
MTISVDVEELVQKSQFKKDSNTTNSREGGDYDFQICQII